MVWTVPDGALIPVAQWTVNDETQENTGTVVVDDVAEEKPPVAVADSFGVRSGAQVSLPLLLNDHDPNKKDVLSISADSTAGGLSDGGFGSLGLAANNQQAVVSVAAGAGSATFTYSVTDGSAVSDPAPVTLTVIPADQNSAPVWCGVESCKQEWPSPQISPGGTVTIPVLSGWVDPEGDPFVLSDARAENSGDPVSVVATADGRVAVRHNDPNASSAAIPIVVTVTDSLGASAEKVLTLVVSSSPALDVSPIVLVAGAGEKTTVKVNDHVTGGSGAYRVVDAVASTNSADLLVVPNAAAGTVELTAARPGEYGVTYSVQDATTLTEQSAVIRLTVPEAGVPLSIAPVTAFVRANEDTTIDILGAVQNSTGRVLIVSQATTGDAALSVSVVGQSQVRVSGTTPTGAGRVGTALVTITDGAGSSVVAQLTVFQVPSSTDSFPITVPDSVTVRAGGQVDIPVLANDLSPRGERLVLHPQIIGSETPGELAFAASDVVRYLAPTTPGVYVLRYSAYLESRPDSLGTATIAVTVIPDGANRSPQPSILTARALSGQTVSIPVSGYGVDPDGDGVVLASVDQPGAGEGVASISAEGDAILYTAPAAGVQGGQVSFAYSVRDTTGGRGLRARACRRAEQHALGHHAHHLRRLRAHAGQRTQPHHGDAASERPRSVAGLALDHQPRAQRRSGQRRVRPPRHPGRSVEARRGNRHAALGCDHRHALVHLLRAVVHLDEHGRWSHRRERLGCRGPRLPRSDRHRAHRAHAPRPRVLRRRRRHRQGAVAVGRRREPHARPLGGRAGRVHRERQHHQGRPAPVGRAHPVLAHRRRLGRQRHRELRLPAHPSLRGHARAGAHERRARRGERGEVRRVRAARPARHQPLRLNRDPRRRLVRRAAHERVLRPDRIIGRDLQRGPRGALGRLVHGAGAARRPDHLDDGRGAGRHPAERPAGDPQCGVAHHRAEQDREHRHPRRHDDVGGRPRRRYEVAAVHGLAVGRSLRCHPERQQGLCPGARGRAARDAHDPRGAHRRVWRAHLGDHAHRRRRGPGHPARRNGEQDLHGELGAMHRDSHRSRRGVRPVEGGTRRRPQARLDRCGRECLRRRDRHGVGDNHGCHHLPVGTQAARWNLHLPLRRRRRPGTPGRWVAHGRRTGVSADPGLSGHRVVHGHERDDVRGSGQRNASASVGDGRGAVREWNEGRRLHLRAAERLPLYRDGSQQRRRAQLHRAGDQLRRQLR
ncbi:MAG: hypothetical protein KKH51_15915 [Actinobacteria bacterium]|nr:hypothetical protein [Actinomycetota bacterium]